MGLQAIQRYILTVFVFFALTLCMISPVSADKPIFLTPYDTGNKKNNENQTNGNRPKATIFLKKDNEQTQKSARIHRRSAVSRVFRNDLSIYKDLKGLDLMKLTSAGGPVTNGDELLKVAAAHRLHNVRSMLKMQQTLDRPAPLPVIEMAEINTPPEINTWSDPLAYALANPGPEVIAPKEAQTKKVKAVYRPNKKKRTMPWRLFGN